MIFLISPNPTEITNVCNGSSLLCEQQYGKKLRDLMGLYMFRDYNKSGSSSPGQRRSNSPAWHAHKEKEYQHKLCANYLSERKEKLCISHL
jgi:hypothetical protein